MRWSVLGLFLVVGCGEPRATEPRPQGQPSPAVGEVQAKKEALVDHEVRSLEGQPMSLAAMRGAALLIVNTASECGFTPQYAGLQAL
ncbi:MAG TPA: glutathione peroxidase, partial [Myxococcota bacterium]|nr:glutathione peroxidase [Myxococcota bacterium]